MEIPFTKNFDGLKTSLLFYIENHWTGFCVIRVFPKRCFGTEYRKFVNVSRSVSGIHLFRCECNLVVFFFFLKSHVQNVTFGKLPFYLLWPKNVSWMIASNFLCFFLIYWRFMHKEITFKIIYYSQKFGLKEHLFKSQLFCISRLEQYGTVLSPKFLSQILTSIRHITTLSLSFIISNFISSSLSFTKKINFLSSKCHVWNFCWLKSVTFPLYDFLVPSLGYSFWLFSKREELLFPECSQ